jgi:sugar phosphate isomerase/epimerase
MSSIPPSPLPSAPATPPTDLLAARPGCFDPFKDDALAMMAECGIRHVELESTPTADEWRTLGPQLSKLNLQVSSISAHVNFAEDPSGEAIARAIDTVNDFGARIIFSSVQSGGRPLDDVYTQLRKLGDRAAKRNVIVAMETHPDLVSNGRRAAATMLGVDHPHIRLNYDSANIFYHNEHCDAGGGIREMLYFLPYLGAVHLKESNGKYHDWWFPALHEPGGIVDFPRLFALCHAADFHGPFTLEIEGITGETVTREKATERIRRSVEYLRSINPRIA